MGTGVLKSGADGYKLVPEHANLGLAVDVERKDGSRGLMVPVLKRADTMTFGEFLDDLRRAGREGAHQQADARRFRRRHHDAHQSGRPRHGRVGAAADARPGDDLRHRLDRLPARVHRDVEGADRRARHRQGDDDHLDLRSPRDPGRGVGQLPQAGGPVPPGRARVLRGDLRGVRPRRPLTPHRRRALSVRHRRPRRPPAGPARCRSPWAARPPPSRDPAAPRRGRDGADQGVPHPRPPRGATRSARHAAGRRPGARPRVGRASTPPAWRPSRPTCCASPCPATTLAEALPHLQATYCGTIAYEVEHIASHEQRVWLRQQIESGAHRPADDRRGAACAPRATHPGRRTRALPRQGLSRRQALLDRGARHHGPDARPHDRARGRGGRARRGARHGAPRPPQRAGAHRRPPV